MCTLIRRKEQTSKKSAVAMPFGPLHSQFSSKIQVRLISQSMGLRARFMYVGSTSYADTRYLTHIKGSTGEKGSLIEISACVGGDMKA